MNNTIEKYQVNFLGHKIKAKKVVKKVAEKMPNIKREMEYDIMTLENVLMRSEDNATRGYIQKQMGVIGTYLKRLKESEKHIK